jgi:hypothetical protein
LLFAAIVLACCAAVSPDSSNAPVERSTPVVAASSATPPAPVTTHELPDTPVAKTLTAYETSADESMTPSAGSISPGFLPASSAAIKPVIREGYETARQRRIWYGLTAVSSGAAAFDAWTTRRALSGNHGVESDPLLRPFAHSDAMYAATQATPLLMDYVGRRMMSSHHEWIRRFWWVPQVAQTSISLKAGIHNYGVVR